MQKLFENFRNFINEGVMDDKPYLSDKKAINSLYKIVSNPEYKNKFLFEAVNDLLKNNTILATKNPYNPIIKIHNIKTLRRITKI